MSSLSNKERNKLRNIYLEAGIDFVDMPPVNKKTTAKNSKANRPKFMGLKG